MNLAQARLAGWLSSSALPSAPSSLVFQVSGLVRQVAAREIMPRYLNVASQRKVDGSLCTDADIATQDALKRGLRAICLLPVVAEEMSEDDQVEQWLAGEEGLWCVDPIDGTSNFVNGIPYFAISVALMRRGKSVLGVVYDPVSGELFHAERGGGAFLGAQRLSLKGQTPALRGAMANVDFKRLGSKISRELVSAPPYMSQRNYGAGTLEWCYLAAGRFDLYLHGGQKLWDYAAGSLILEEAGGCMCTLDQDEFDSGSPWKRSIVATHSPALFAPWRDWVRAHR
ncbi:MAG: inositol monophosphatase family protein [Betaproteobacteria bacterium]|nr:inositol monophosphatase family protein [Betaproteobacteria bacterium]